MDAKLKELQDKKNALSTEIRTLAEKQSEWNDEQRGQWEKINGEYDTTVAAMDERRKELTESEAVQARLKEIEDERKAANKDQRIGVDEVRRREENPESRRETQERNALLAFQAWTLTQAKMELRDEHREACKAVGFNPSAKEIPFVPAGMSFRYGDPSFSRGGIQPPREIRAGLDVATSGAGIETIPEGFMAQLEKKTLAYGNVRQVARVIQTASGNDMPWPVVTDTANEAAILAEATTIGTSVDPTFSAITLKAFKLSSKPVFVSAEIMQDSAFNLASELADMIGTRFGRGETTYFTTGTDGGTQPQGIVTAAGTGVTTSSATAFTADELLNLIHSLDPSYRALPSTGFMFHDTALLYIRKLKDANGAYLWQPGLQMGVPDRVADYPYAINQKMEPLVSNVPVTAKKHVLFGAFEKYIIRDAGGVRMYHLTERYRDVDQDCFVAFKRIDGRALNADALKVMLQA